ncbi:SusC/RagA family TonB-linked outer membrane protein [Sunxiuqinia rutila]|uniref:SusC/RagA family TonB-linked outer membrane protein n=1 Tax=Sunxiuqinia rutila TaxID=1397841 RepID=UPI003D36F6D9
MRLTLGLLFVLVLQGWAVDSYSQKTSLNLDMKDAGIVEILNEIENQTDFYFLFNYEQMNANKKMNVKLSNANIESTLDYLLKETGLEYTINERQIVISKGKDSNQTNPFLLQQKKSVSGKITNSLNEPIPGATVLIKGTMKGTVTDIDGRYTLSDLASNATLVFSFVGMKSQEVMVGNQDNIDIVLQEDYLGVEEVVVVGYGTMEKREVTSSITSVKDKDLIPGLSGNPLTAMQGKVTGLSIHSDNGTSPNSSTSVQLRGVASVLAGQGPLIVIDGIPGGSLNSVSREDIESIDILKDASAGAIYGTRAAGGVILITTKQARAGKIRLTYTSEFTTETIRKTPEVLSAEEFVTNGLGQDFGHTTDWYDEVTVDNPFRQRHHINLRGGSETSKIYATFLTSEQEGIAIGDQKSEIGGRINASFELVDGFAEIITHADYRKTESDKSHNGIFNQALKLNPTLTPYDDSQVHGLNVWTGGWEYYNPVADIRLRDDQTANHYFLGDVTLKLRFTPHLSSQAMVATRNRQYRDIYYQSAQHKGSLDNSRAGHAKQGYGQSSDKTFEWLANYLNEIGDHTINAVAGYSFQEFNADGFSMENYDFPVDGIQAWDMGKGTYLSDGKAKMSSWKDPRERLIAFFARANYSYKDKYMLTVSSRYEGSSKFYKDHRWGLFPAISGGWRISNEPFADGLSFVDDLKIRGGYGVTGNQSFAPGVASRMYKSDTWWPVNGEWVYAYGSAHNQNKNLQWEEKKELNIGVDFTLFDSKLSGKFDIYDRKVDQMIYDISVSVPPAVHDKTTMNVGSLRNKGWETELTYNPVRSKDWNYTTTIRASHNKSVLESLWGSQTYWDRVSFPAPGSPGTAVRLYPGQEIGKFYVWKFAGFTEEGNWMLYDKDGNAFDVTKQTKTNEDKYFVGNAIPKLRLSWDHSVRYKNWEMNAFFTSWIGHDVYNTIDMYYGLPNVEEQNVLKHAFDKHKDVVGEKELSDYWIEDADFIKLKALTLRYNFDTSLISQIQSANIYLTGRDLFTLTKYSGMDPESNVNGLEPGFEWHNNIYPRTRVWTLGVQLTF